MRDYRSLRRGLDLFEQVTVALLYGWLFVRLCPDELSGLSGLPLLLLVSEGIVVAFLVLRRRTENTANVLFLRAREELRRQVETRGA